MVNYNGQCLPKETVGLSIHNRAFRYGDGVFETIRVIHSKIIFWESHYLRMMANMRIIRMDIPMHYTMEYFEEEINKLLLATNSKSANMRLRLTIYREAEGLYTPQNEKIGFLMEMTPLAQAFFVKKEGLYKVGLFKEYLIAKDFLSTVKTTNRIKNVIGGIFAEENELDNCLLLNTDKNVIEALNGNLFLVKDNRIQTPPLSDGCINGVIRKQLLEIIEHMPDYTIDEVPISPFSLQKADALFITNAIVGIQAITNYRKKVYAEHPLLQQLLAKLNAKARLGV
ncbi:MAG: aminotransferase class IV [Flavobacteriaceae bacterium]|nr:aminotransferase class IV [Flavobacteriaceae bacterium]